MRYQLIVVCLLLFNGCAIFDAGNIAPRPDFRPLSGPMAEQQALRLTQQVKGQWGEHRYTLLCVLELHPQRVALVGLSPLGLQLFAIDYDGVEVALEKTPLVPAALEPQAVLADLQLVYWSAAELGAILGERWRIVDEIVDKETRRSLYEEDLLTVEIRYSSSAPFAEQVVLRNYPLNYWLEVKTIAIEKLE